MPSGGEGQLVMSNGEGDSGGHVMAGEVVFVEGH